MKQQEMFGNAIWVGADEDCSSPLIRGSFTVANARKARIRICGLGYFALWINGRRVSDDLLVPANSSYAPRNLSLMEYPIHDELHYRIYCMEYDVTAYLNPGENTLGVQLGTGWYAQSLRWAEGYVGFGYEKLCFSLEWTERNGQTGSFVSNTALKWAQSELTFNNLYFGEVYNFALLQPGWAENGFDDSAWNPCLPAEQPESELCIQDCPADRVIRTIEPSVHKRFAAYTVYDCGENITGFAVVAAQRSGETVELRYAEELHADGSLDFGSCGGEGQIQTNRYENCVAGMEMHPRFCWHGFRYISVTNNAQLLRVCVVHADTPVTSSFSSDSAELNWLYDAYIRTQLCNMHGGVPSDCPHIERLGYTGDGQLCCEAALLLLDAKRFYRKWLTDIADCQDKKSGHIQHTAPFAGGGGGPGGWGGAVVVVPYVYYKEYGDREVLREFLPKMLRYFDYMESRCDNGIVYREEEGGWCLGDWLPPEPIAIPEPYVNTALYVKFMEMAKEIAAILGQQGETTHLDAWIARSKQSLTRMYYSPQSRNFMGNIQGANAYAVDIGLGCDQTFSQMAAIYQKRGEYDTGIIATDLVTRLLFERGEQDTALSLLTSHGNASFYNMKKQGATTLWENWNGERSHSHPMFGAVTRFLFRHILGIGQAEGSAGYENIVIAPKPVQGLSKASGHVTTCRGKIAVAFEKQGGNTRFTVELADGMDGVFLLGETRRKLIAGMNEIIL